MSDAARERERYATNPDYRRRRLASGQRWREANRDKSRAAARRWYHANGERERERIRIRNANRRHGGNAAEIADAFWVAQQGRCYLCEQPFANKSEAFIDHDHRCCPRNRSCADCRRGLACDNCNQLIGRVRDDATLLHLIARNLEAAQQHAIAGDWLTAEKILGTGTVATP